jgi:hypothetical protein
MIDIIDSAYAREEQRLTAIPALASSLRNLSNVVAGAKSPVHAVGAKARRGRGLSVAKDDLPLPAPASHLG